MKSTSVGNQTMNGTILKLHIQKWYAQYLRSMRVDIVEADETSATFGWPNGGGDSGLIKFTARKDGSVQVKTGAYIDRISRTVWDEAAVYPDVDCYLQMFADNDPSEKPEKPLECYRRY